MGEEGKELTSSVLDSDRSSPYDDDVVQPVFERILSVDEGLLDLSERGSERSHGEGVGRSESEDGYLRTQERREREMG